MIRTPDDVLRHFGADVDEMSNASLEVANRRLSHRVYKDTECGAWAHIEACTVERNPRRARRNVTWRAEYVDSITGVRVRRVRIGHGKWLRGDAIPRAARDFLCVDSVGRLTLDYPRASAFLAACENATPTKVRNGAHVVTFELPAPRAMRATWCVRMGSIVEGIDAEVTADPVVLPCKAKALDAAVVFVESEAAALWNDTHGCEHCGMDGEINPDCTHCEGYGEIL